MEKITKREIERLKYTDKESIAPATINGMLYTTIRRGMLLVDSLNGAKYVYLGYGEFVETL